MAKTPTATKATKHYRNPEAIANAIDLITTVQEKLKISRSDLAGKLGVTIPQVTNALSGEADIRISTIARYLQVMGYELQIAAKRIGDPIPSNGKKASAPAKVTSKAATKRATGATKKTPGAKKREAAAKKTTGPRAKKQTDASHEQAREAAVAAAE